MKLRSENAVMLFHVMKLHWWIRCWRKWLSQVASRKNWTCSSREYLEEMKIHLGKGYLIQFCPHELLRGCDREHPGWGCWAIWYVTGETVVNDVPKVCESHWNTTESEVKTQWLRKGWLIFHFMDWHLLPYSSTQPKVVEWKQEMKITI